MAATNFDTSRVRFGDLVAAVAGLVLFISLFLNWYKVSVAGIPGVPRGASQGHSGWTWLGFLDIVLLLIAVIAIGVAVLRAAGAVRRLPVTPGLLLLGAGALATLFVLFRLLVVPGSFEGVEIPTGVDVERSFGILVALIGAIGVTVGGWLDWNEEGRPSPGEAPAAAGPQPPAAAAAPPAQPAAPQQQGSWPPPEGGAADWYPDPSGQKRVRYWDGTQWTDHTAD